MSEPKGWNAAGINDCPICAKQGLKTCSGGAHRNAMIEDKVIIPGNTPLPNSECVEEYWADEAIRLLDLYVRGFSPTDVARDLVEKYRVLPENADRDIFDSNPAYPDAQLLTFQGGEDVKPTDDEITEAIELLQDDFRASELAKLLASRRLYFAALKENARLKDRDERATELEEAQEGWLANAMEYAKRAVKAEATVAQRDEEIARLKDILNTPETDDFFKGIELEASHQRLRWPSDHDTGKSPADWFWLIGYLAGKCLHAHIAGNTEKALHHTISTAGALANWHLAIKGLGTMRPGIDTPVEAELARVKGGE